MENHSEERPSAVAYSGSQQQSLFWGALSRLCVGKATECHVESCRKSMGPLRFFSRCAQCVHFGLDSELVLESWGVVREL
eukprot:1995995-Amphidinium_carterae.1